MSSSNARAADYRLQHRLWGWLGCSAFVLLCLSCAMSLWQIISAIAPQTRQLGQTVMDLRLNEIEFELGVFQGKISGQELQRLNGLGDLVPFCFSARDIHAQTVEQACLGKVSAHPVVMEQLLQQLLRLTTQDTPISSVPLVRYPGIIVGELSISPHWAAQAALLWQHWLRALWSAGVLVSMVSLGYWAARRALRPTGIMMHTLEQLEAGDLHVRMPQVAPYELQRISSTFNRMVQRLQDTMTAHQQLADQLLTLQEDERRHLARELHDELGQTLAYIRVEVAFIGEVARESAPSLLPSVDALTRSCEQMVMSIRHVVQQLRPPGLETFGLASSVRHLIAHWQHRDGGRCRYELEIQGDIDGWDDTLTVSIYRLVQEGLTNAIRHGHASWIKVQLTADTDGVQVLIQDDGILTELPPTPSPSPLSGGQGLLGMRERVLALGGVLSMQICTPHGLRLDIRLPLQERNHVASVDCG